MGTAVIGTLNADRLARLPAQRQGMARAADVGNPNSAKFTFFAAFDGTNNNKDALPAGALQTNAANLFDQAETLGSARGYYRGVGTGGEMGNIINAGVAPTGPIRVAAEKAYEEFVESAKRYLTANPTATPQDLSAAVVGVSRGGPTAVLFAQFVNDRGLRTETGAEIAPPRSVKISSMALLDPVARFVDGDMRLPGNVQSALVVLATDENRFDFRPLNYQGDSRVTTIAAFGNHMGGVGGGEDKNGLAASVLEGVTAYFQGRNTALADVPTDKRFDASKPVLLYSEVWQTAANGEILEHPISGERLLAWRADDPTKPRQTYVVTPETEVRLDPNGTSGVITQKVGTRLVTVGLLLDDNPDIARETFRASEIREVNRMPVAPELAAATVDVWLFGLTFDALSTGDVPEPVAALVESLDHATQTANGWAPPQLTITDLGDGLTERRITLGSGAELASVRDDDRRVLRVVYQRDDTDSTGAPRRTITTENRNADGSADGPVEDLRLRQTDTGNWLPQSRTWRSTSTDSDSGERSSTETRTTYASDGFSATGSETATTRHDASGQLQSAQRTTYDGSGTTVLSQETTTRQADNSLRTDTRDGQGQLVGRRQVWVFDDGTALASDLDADGRGTMRSTDATGADIMVMPVAHDGGIEGTTGTATVALGGKPVTLRVDFSNGELWGIEQIDGRAPLNAPLVNAAAKDSGITVHDLAFGRGAAPVRQLAEAADPANPTGALEVPNPAGGAEQQTALNLLPLVVTLAEGFRSGNPRVIASAILGIGSHVFKDNALLQQANAGFGIFNGLIGLRDAVKRGDPLAVAYGAASLGKSALTYLDAAKLADGPALKAALAELDKVIPVLGFLNSLAKDDALGTFNGLVQLDGVFAWDLFPPWMSSTPWTIFVGVLAFIFNDPDPKATVEFLSSNDGRNVAYRFFNVKDGGDQFANGLAANLVNALRVEIEGRPELGIIAKRLPNFRYKDQQVALFAVQDDDNSVTYARSFDEQGVPLGFGIEVFPHANPVGSLVGRPYADPADAAYAGEVAKSPGFHAGLPGQFVSEAYEAGAIAPTWMVRTVDAQTARGDVLAGLNAVQRARQQGHLLPHNPGDAVPGNAGQVGATSQQTWNPIALDLDGNGLTVTPRATGGVVLIDVDSDGFAEASDWISPRDGVLVLDRDGDGAITVGHEMFSDARVNMAARGLGALDELDANGDRKLTSQDFVFAHLRVWQDIDHDGQIDEHELTSMESQGIDQLDIAAGTFRKAGQAGAMATVSLQADSSGVATRAADARPGSMLLIEETGAEYFMAVETKPVTGSGFAAQVSYASADGVLVGTAEVVQTAEDIPVRVSAEQLLANDGGGSGASLTVTGVGAAAGGTVTWNAAARLIEFTPTADFAGQGGFDYLVSDGQGRQVTVRAVVDVAALNDAPRVVANHRLIRDATWKDLIRTPMDEWSSGFFFEMPDRNVLLGPVQPELTGVQVQSTRADGSQVVGFKDGRMYVGNAVGPREWQSVSIQEPNKGRLEVTDPDLGPGSIQFTEYEALGARFGTVVINPTTGEWTYTRTDFGHGLDDAFYIKVTDGSGGETAHRVEVVADDPVLLSADDRFAPLILDLNDNGFRLIHVDDSEAFFDVSGDGLAERIGWTSGADGILAFDANQDGRIDRANEISFVGYVPGAETDLEGLAAFDTNHDGQLSAADAQWGLFRVWQDVDQNGVQTAGELMSLEQRGIAAISLASDGNGFVSAGNTVFGTGSFTRVDGSVGQLADVAFARSDETPRANPDDDFTLGPAGQTVNTGTGADKVRGSAEADTVYAGPGDDKVDGGAGDDLLYGNAGDDLIDGGVGNDTVDGGRGADTLWGGGGNDVVGGGSGSDRLFGGEGNDTVRGGDGNDVLAGDAGDDRLFGEQGVDYISGGRGHDWLDGGTGGDRMAGNAGDDIYWLDEEGDQVYEEVGQGLDLVLTPHSFTSSPHVENVVLLGSADALVLAGDGDNRLYGNQGNNALFGGGGVDIMVGGGGNDTYSVDHADDVVLEWADGTVPPASVFAIDSADLAASFFNASGHEGFAGAHWGTDTVVATVSYSLPDAVENLTLSGPHVIHGTGNDAANRILGNETANTLRGLGGDDTLEGGAGNDVLDGGAGEDVLDGGAGNDVYVMGNSGAGFDRDRIVNLQGSDTIRLPGGTNWADVTVSAGAGGGLGTVTWTGGEVQVSGDSRAYQRLSVEIGNVRRTLASLTGNLAYLAQKEGRVRDSVTYAARQGFLRRQDDPGATETWRLVQSDSAHVGNFETYQGAVSVDVRTGAGNNSVNLYTGGGVVKLGDGDDSVGIDFQRYRTRYSQPNPGMQEFNDDNAYLYGSRAPVSFLDGGAGNDVLVGGMHGDVLYGGPGYNLLQGRDGPDRYLVLDDEPAAGAAAPFDLIVDATRRAAETFDESRFYGGQANEWLPPETDIDTVEFGPGIDIDDVGFEVRTPAQGLPYHPLLGSAGVGAGDRFLVVSHGQRIMAAIHLPQSNTLGVGVEYLQFQGGTVLSMASALSRALAGSVQLAPLPDMQIREGDAVRYELAREWFRFPAGTAPALAVTLLDGSPLPGWLNWNANTLTLTGVAPMGFAGDLQLTVAGMNTAANVTNGFSLTVQRRSVVNANSDPVAGEALVAADAQEGTPYRWQLPEAAFSDADAGDVLTWSFVPDDPALGQWLTFDPATRTFSGTPQFADLYQSIEGTVLVTDREGATASQRITISVGDVPGEEYVGTDGNDSMTGTVGADLFRGGLGADTMRGGAGQDAYYVENTGDRVIERANEGFDRVVSSINYTLPANVEGLSLDPDAGAIDGNGNTLNNEIAGNDAANKLFGNAGNDTMWGGGGDDWLRGGAGTDVLEGGPGDDFYTVEDDQDTVTELEGEGLDVVEASVSFALPDHVENLILVGADPINGLGNDGDNLLQGNAAANYFEGGLGADTFNGRQGADTLVGGAGDDTYLFEDDVDQVVESAGEGRDKVVSRFDLTLPAEVEDGLLAGSARNLAGNVLVNVLAGNAQANWLDGAAGADVMIGYKGNDTYVVDDRGDTVVEADGEGTDSVEASVDYALPEFVEHLVLMDGAEAGMGNALNNRLTGNAASNKLFGEAGNDTLDGGAGADMLFGGVGNDLYFVDSADDLVIELAGEGTDTAQASVSFALPDHVENLLLTGTGNINAVGNALNNRIEGNSGSNVLFGGGGNDTYVFGLGAGHDVVANFDAGKPSGDRIQLGEGIVAADLSLTRHGADLVISLAQSADRLTVVDYFLNAGKGSTALERIRFHDGTSWTHATVSAQAITSAVPADLGSMPPAVRNGDTTGLADSPDLAASRPVGATDVPANVSDAIAAVIARFDQDLRTRRSHADADGTMTRGAYVESRALPMLWALHDAQLDMQLAKTTGRFAGSISIDARMATDLGATHTLLSGVQGANGRLDQVSRPAQLQAFELAQFQ